jgi:hypothetical protein
MVRIVLNHALRKMPRLRGGLGMVNWIQNIRPCRPQSLQYYIQQLTKKAENRRVEDGHKVAKL